MYGTAYQADPGAIPNNNLRSASPIPKQWMDQDSGAQPGQDRTISGATGVGMYQNQTQSQDLPNNTGNTTDSSGPTEQRGYYRPGLRSPSPTIQKRLEAMSGNDNNNLQNGIGAYNNYGKKENGGTSQGADIAGRPPSSGLIRLSLKKPMGIVFEPMTDPHNTAQQRGVRICDLPRTGAAAMSRKLEIGDELLSINDKTMSRLTFDEIMDFIIEADPDNVNLLFRRPKKEKDQPKIAPKRGVSFGEDVRNEPVTRSGSAVKWVDNDDKEENKQAENNNKDTDEGRKKKDSLVSRVLRRPTIDDESVLTGDETAYTQETEEFKKNKWRRFRGGKKRYGSESFLDTLIDSLCAPIVGDNSRRRGRDDDYDSDDDLTYNSFDDSTYVDDYSEKKGKKDKRNNKGKNKDANDNSYRNDSEEQNRKSVIKEKYSDKNSQNSRDNYKAPSKSSASQASREQEIGDPYNKDPTIETSPHEHDENIPEGTYEDDATLETVGTLERAKMLQNRAKNGPVSSHVPLGLAPPDEDNLVGNFNSNIKSNHIPSPIKENEESVYEPDANIPMTAIEYDDDDPGADVSVMESLGGPSLLIENMRHNAAIAAGTAAASPMVLPVSPELIASYGTNYPTELGLTKEETVQLDPDKFYHHVVKELLQSNEPEKVRLLDKLLAKYKGREEHLIRKLSDRYVSQNDEDLNVKDNINKESNQIQDANEEKAPTFDDDGFQSFGAFPKVTSKDAAKNIFGSDPWPTIGEEDNENDSKDDRKNEKRKNEFGEDETDGSQSSYTDSDEYDSIDGTSPAVIAQVSELLNYVYGKTSVTGQIDRVSTIMRAYEGREAVLLELLETKAIIKANAENDDVINLPESLRDNPGLHNKGDEDPNRGQMRIENTKIPSTEHNSDVSSMSYTAESIRNTSITSPANDEGKDNIKSPLRNSKPNYQPRSIISPDNSDQKKKKKGLFGIFGGKRKGKNKNKEAGGAFPNSAKGNKKNAPLSAAEDDGWI
mmetsp:Transcript_3895/g.5301  ORF Transcript_3895/g.5301 Transcript_3895/m.5301 type:complete len:996 (+) Transcript_3895:173-3160(+)|eukprot:CAMPEP_0184868648 /NCGR_PEP_ID=MMETSP0580-20130426/31213_1 /TAXON_ID=1118495 /ORGANISM="Dactyliosolen fragilissimus" /LENGTH=995 /DNA_ID=CAMNT_0027369673 /DNA_START=134 /DNA_END=3121 /DNA_ORIENTATION=+